MECVGGWSISGKVRRYGTRGGRIEVGRAVENGERERDREREMEDKPS